MAEDKNLEELGFPQLQAEAKARKIDTRKIKSKVGLIEAITKYEKDNPDSPPEDEIPPTPEEVEEANTPDEEEENTPEGDGGGELEDPEEEETPKVKAKTIDIKGPIDIHGKKGFIRTYCEEIHGKDYKELVAQFIGMRPVPRGTVIPEDNKGRTAESHDSTFSIAIIVDADGRERATFSREKHGILFREKAMAYCSAGLPKRVQIRKNEWQERDNEIIFARVELRK